MRLLRDDVLANRDVPTKSRIFGPVVFKELQDLFKDKSVK
jgi:hypothetical protein